MRKTRTDIKFHSLFIVIVKEAHTHTRTHEQKESCGTRVAMGTRATDECGHIQFQRGITINTRTRYETR